MDFLFPESVTDLATVPEQFRPMYAAAEDGKTHSLKKNDATVKGAVEAIIGLGKSLKASRTDTENERKKKVDLSPLKDWGEDPASIANSFNAKLKELQDQLAQGGKAKIDLDSLRADMTKAHNKEKEGWETRLKTLKGQLFTVLVENNAKSALAADALDVDLALPFVKNFIKTVEEDGQVKIYVVDEQDNRRYGPNGADMTIAELVNEMRISKKYAPLFKSNTPKGGGTPPGAGSGRQKAGDDKAEKSSVEKIQIGLNKGQHTSAGAGARSKAAGGTNIVNA